MSEVKAPYGGEWPKDRPAGLAAKIIEFLEKFERDTIGYQTQGEVDTLRVELLADFLRKERSNQIAELIKEYDDQTDFAKEIAERARKEDYPGVEMSALNFLKGQEEGVPGSVLEECLGRSIFSRPLSRDTVLKQLPHLSPEALDRFQLVLYDGWHDIWETWFFLPIPPEDYPPVDNTPPQATSASGDDEPF